MLRHLPNTLTCCNLLCGCLGIVWLQNHDRFFLAAVVIGAACVFDFLDGFAARMLKVSSPIGKELDSLADMVTFGVLPSLVMLHYCLRHVYDNFYIALISLLLAVFSALRLAKFNIDTRQSDGFIGVPTPATALFFVSLPPALEYFDITLNVYGFVGLILLFCYLMVCPLPLFALKFKHFKWAGNELRFTFLLAAVLLIAIFNVAGVALTIILYILASLVIHMLGTQKK